MNQGLRGHTVDPAMTMMFTRLDSEHNTKALLKSTKIGRINEVTNALIFMNTVTGFLPFFFPIVNFELSGCHYGGIQQCFWEETPSLGAEVGSSH